MRYLFLLLAPVALGAQTPQSPPTSDDLPVPVPPTLQAVRATQPIRIDGRLDEPEWARVAPARGFRQLQPNEGQPATHATEVRVMYDHHALYIGARMFDSEPEKIRAQLARRDEGVTGSDLLEVMIDSYHGRVSGFMFRITPAGAIRDATVNSSGNTDASWDAVFESAAAIDSLGWTTELRIPFSQLRYAPKNGGQTFGINFRRSVGRLLESTEYSFTPRRVAGGPQRWGTLAGLEGLPRSRYLELMPYVTSRAEFPQVAADNPFRSDKEFQLKGGFDVRYGLTSGVTLSGTVNPDFGQVEVDPARVNLTANELFFPERRPFFVEGAEIFRFGQIRAFNNGSFPTLFHSRRIGRTPQRRIDFQHPFADMPEEATIAAAAKIAGQPRPGLSVGLLDALTLRETAPFQDEAGARGSAVVEPLTNYFVNRLRQDFRGGNTQVGALVTAVNRDLADEALAQLLRRDAYYAGLDFSQSWKERMYVVNGSFGRSAVLGSPSAINATQRSSVRYFQRPDLEADHLDPDRTSLYGNAWQFSAAKVSGRRLLASIAAQSVSPGFEVNDVGFQSQAGYRGVFQGGGIRQETPGRIFRNWFVGPFSGKRWNFDGDEINSHLGLSADWRLLNFWGGWMSYGVDGAIIDDRLTRGGPVVRRSGGRFANLGLVSDQRKIYTIESGSWYNERESNSRSLGWWAVFAVRPSSALRVSVAPEISTSRDATQFLRSVEDAAAVGTFGRRYVFGDLRYNQLSLETRVDWTFTPRLSLQVFAQPLVASGDYRGFRSLRQSRTFEFDDFTEADGTLTQDEDGYLAHPPGGPDIRIGQPDFTTLALVGNAVVRWEYRPGSALFFVWQQRRNGFEPTPGFSPGRDLGGIFSERPENVFAIKASYWIGR
ncbi:hypothetical protein BH23GEM2_BH23GEM2_16460 [soil metagenome]